MGHPRRYFEHNCVYFVTNRMVKGLPLVPCGYINKVLEGIMAMACNIYPDISICHYLWMSNHYHMIIVTNGDPADIAGFMHIVNGETGKAVTRFLGVRNVKIWGQRYNAVRLLTPETVVKKIAYLYLNPVNDDLVEQAHDWPGVSSYGIEEDKKIECEYLSPSKLKKLPNSRLSNRTNQALINESKKGKEYKLSVKPYAWVNCFDNPESIDSYRLQIQSKISTEEANLKIARKRRVFGADKVSTQNPYQHHQPKNDGKRVFCMSSCLELRKKFIELYKDFCNSCIHTWQCWKEGKFEYKFPPGAFIPPLLPISNCLKFQT